MPEREKRQERREERPLSKAGKGEYMILSVPFILSNYEDAENPWPTLQSCLAEASRTLCLLVSVPHRPVPSGQLPSVTPDSRTDFSYASSLQKNQKDNSKRSCLTLYTFYDFRSFSRISPSSNNKDVTSFSTIPSEA